MHLSEQQRQREDEMVKNRDVTFNHQSIVRFVKMLFSCSFLAVYLLLHASPDTFSIYNVLGVG